MCLLSPKCSVKPSHFLWHYHLICFGEKSFYQQKQQFRMKCLTEIYFYNPKTLIWLLLYDMSIFELKTKLSGKRRKGQRKIWITWLMAFSENKWLMFRFNLPAFLEYKKVRPSNARKGPPWLPRRRMSSQGRGKGTVQEKDQGPWFL